MEDHPVEHRDDDQGASSAVRELDVVRVVRLHAPTRAVDGTEGHTRQPRVGDYATIVHVHGECAVIAECVDPEGHTLWTADFEVTELELET